MDILGEIGRVVLVVHGNVSERRRRSVDAKACGPKTLVLGLVELAPYQKLAETQPAAQSSVLEASVLQRWRRKAAS